MSESDFNEELIARLKAGDEHAFVELFSRHRDRLKRMLEFRMDRRLRGREDTSDILEEVYLDAHQRMRHYLKRPELSFYIWLRQLTTQRLIDIHRRHLKAEMRDVKQEISIHRHHASSTSASMAMLLVAHLASPSQMAMQDELVMQIEEALESMDEIDREILACDASRSCARRSRRSVGFEASRSERSLSPSVVRDCGTSWKRCPGFRDEA